MSSIFKPTTVIGLGALVLVVILISNMLQKGDTVNTFAKNTYGFLTSSMKALEVGSGYGTAS